MGNQTKPLITVVTVCYNAVNELDKTMQSVLNQIYDNIEYIVIDGGSTDGTVDVIKKYADRLAYWVSEPDKGIYDAMNKGIKASTGEWINFMNAGDWFYKNTTLSEVFERGKNEAGVIYGSVNMVYSTYSQIVHPQMKPSKKNPMPFNHQSVFVRTIFMKERPFDTTYKYVADYNFFFNIVDTVRFVESEVIVSSYSTVGYSSQNIIAVNAERIKINPCYYNYYQHFRCYRNNFVKKVLFIMGISADNVRKKFFKK